MALSAKALRRAFTYNGLTLPDPDPSLSPEAVKGTFTAIYPELTTASVDGPKIVADLATYSFVRAVRDKGAAAVEKLHYRLRDASGSSVSVSCDPDSAVEGELAEAAADVVAMAFARLLPGPVKSLGKTPEILSQSTVDHIEELEETLQAMRNLMIDHEPAVLDEHWEFVMGRADALLGLTASEGD
jgi:PRTRC genetic system protein C